MFVIVFINVNAHAHATLQEIEYCIGFKCYMSTIKDNIDMIRTEIYSRGELLIIISVATRN